MVQAGPSLISKDQKAWQVKGFVGQRLHPWGSIEREGQASRGISRQGPVGAEAGDWMGVERGRQKHPLTGNTLFWKNLIPLSTRGLALAPEANIHLASQAFLFTQQISASSLPSIAASTPDYEDTRITKTGPLCVVHSTSSRGCR